jgi:hypothetical protein
MSAFPIQSAKSGVVVAPIKVTITATDVGEVTIGKNVATLSAVDTSDGSVSLVISPQWRRGLMDVVVMGMPTAVDTTSPGVVLATAGTYAVAVKSSNTTTGAVELISGIALAADFEVHLTLGLVYRPDRKGFE